MPRAEAAAGNAERFREPQNHIVLIRHAPSIYDKARVPPRDPIAALDDDAAFTECLAALPGDAEWWVSPLRRCRMTAQRLVELGANPAAITYDARLVEQDYGNFHDRAIADVWEEVKDAPRSPHHFIHHDFTPPGGESFTALHHRMKQVADDLRVRESSLVVISHAMVMRSLIAHAQEIDCAETYRLEIPPLSVRKICFRG